MADFELPGYELYERIGRGGMATVYRALHLNLDREVAIKVMDPSMNRDETFSERFIREARISARLTHPHILQIYDVNAFQGMNYIAMELLTGGELADFIHGEMPQKQIYQILRQMTDALDYASGRGYVHRDIKPSNIMLRAREDFVLTDFGIARASDSGTQMTQTGLMVGTPSYMSPEQAKGEEVDGRSDLYALAVLAYEMLSKTLPYESDSPVTTAVKHLTDAIPTLSGRLSAYQAFFNRGLAKSAEERFQTGRELYQAFLAASVGFDDNEVLTAALDPAPRPPSTGGGATNGQGSSLAGLDATRLSQPSSPAITSLSRPYHLEGNSQRERLVSGAYPRRPGRKPGGGVLRWIVVPVIVAGLGVGGYTWWQGQREASGTATRTVMSDPASGEDARGPDHTRAQRERFEAALASVDESLAAGELDAAAAALETAAQIAGDGPELQARRQQLQSAREQLAAQAAAEQARDTALDEADALVQRLGQDPGSAMVAVDLYTGVLELYPDNARAAQGIDAVVDYYLGIARQSAEEGDFDGSRQALASAEQVVPGNTGVAGMSDSLPGLEQAWQQRQAEAEAAARRATALAEQKKIEQTAARGMRALESGALEVAQRAYDEIAAGQGDMDAVRQLQLALVQGYATAARQQIDFQEFDAAQAIVGRGAAHFPDDGLWVELETEIETARTNARRRLGVY